ncbi:ABC-type transporter Mla maintaining outer membrane lipid asymmetry ATPase subunit MlaF [Actinomycetospora cinnamomea]|uniref:ABC-type transporter Mla maintaining outer membrane lipid asymmetry ATPase subunit MlaF n=1 Tax=Actinomycetospora cinnamomea TaxID=663609 RepID=A0A2U1FDD8_9PSEU|nr:ABC-type transporter Mla maintaining outer membrane lipid asymmetry ATPase subunit MlaF [Actinomycetospora cinnamomea]
MAGVEVGIKNLSKSFGSSTIWSDVTLTLPAGEVSVLLGPSGTGKSVLLKSIIGLLKPEKGSIFIHDTDLVRCSESKLYEIRKLFGVLFQDGALFGSMNLFDNIAFPLREHTRKGEKEISDIVMEKLDMVGLSGAEDKLPGEISGGMKKRAGLARALVLDPEIILVDEPDSGLDPVRTAYLNQLIVDLNAQLDATILIVTHHLGTARSLPDNIGMLFRRNLVMFGPREVLLTSEEPVVQQFLQGRRIGPIGMSEEKDSAQMEAEMEELKKKGGSAESEESFIDPQLEVSEGMPERKAVQRRKDRVMQVLHTLPYKAQTAILEQLTEEDQERYGISRDQDRTELIEITYNNPPEDADPFGYKAMSEAEDNSMVEGSPAGEGEGEGDQAGSGDPNADAEARKAPPAPPESDEPLVGVPADEDAGGTVVLPQAGEHTKDDSEKSDETGASPSDQEDDQQDGSGQQQGDRQDQDEPRTEQIPVARDDSGQATEQTEQSDQQGTEDDQRPTEQVATAGAAAAASGGRHHWREESEDQDAQVAQGGSGLVPMERRPDREGEGQQGGSAPRSSREADRSGWAAPAAGQDTAPDASGEAAGDPPAEGGPGSPQQAAPATDETGRPQGGDSGIGSSRGTSGTSDTSHDGGPRGRGDNDEGLMGGLKRMFRRSAS